MMEGLLTQIMYDIPSDPSIEEVTITAESVATGAAPILVKDPERAGKAAKKKTGKGEKRISSEPAS